MAEDNTLYTDLPDGEGALLWAMRAWVVGHCRNEDLSRQIAVCLGRFGRREAPALLDGFMTALSRGARRRIEVNCVCHPELSEDERLLLDVFALQQAEGFDDAYTLLRGIATERAAVAAGDSAQRLVLLFEAAGVLLPWRPAPQRPAASAFAGV